MKSRATILILSIIIFSQCVTSEQFGYSKLISKFKKESICRDSINWAVFESEVLSESKNSKQDAIRKALTLNGNSHTFYMDHGIYLHGTFKIDSRLFEKPPAISDLEERLGENIGYIQIPSLPMNPDLSDNEKGQLAYDYAHSIQQKILSQDKNELKGWVIDLRSNSGGNMWPMLMALSPYYEDGVLGYFIGPDKEQIWSKKSNEIFLNKKSQNKRFALDPVDIHLKNKNFKIAVLISRRTSSSGEGVAISFASLPNVRFFGEKSSGHASANEAFKMAEFEYLVLTTSVMADSKKKIYPSVIKVESTIEGEDDLIKVVKRWILSED